MSDSDITSANKWQEFFDEFNNESSRGSALITVAFLDAQLQKLIENHFISDPSETRRFIK